MAKDEQSETRTYRRDDRALMIEVRPGQFISESARPLLVCSNRADSTQANPAATRKLVAEDGK